MSVMSTFSDGGHHHANMLPQRQHNHQEHDWRHQQHDAGLNDNHHRHEEEETPDGTRLTYAELNALPPQDPAPETYAPTIERGVLVVDPANNDVQVLPPAGGEEDEEPLPPVFLKREHRPSRAYARIPDRVSISLDHHAPGWGEVIFAITYYCVDGGNGSIFQAPAEDDVEFVVVKKLNKAVVLHSLANGGREDPRIEIARMQELGDDVHVLRCVEALEDDEYWYIVSPRAVEPGTLKDAICWYSPHLMDAGRARSLYVQILNILVYLERRGICHRDLSPDNFLFLSPDRIVAYDLAMSLRIPVVGDIDGRHRTLIRPQGPFGTVAWMSPEIVINQVFDGVATDLWSATHILYNLLTNQVLYEVPFPTDISFRYYLQAGGIASDDQNERTVEVLNELDRRSHTQEAQKQRHRLEMQAWAHLQLSPSARKLLTGVFRLHPANRWTLGDVIDSAFVRNNNEDD